jgi:hypothetical protein
MTKLKIRAREVLAMSAVVAVLAIFSPSGHADTSVFTPIGSSGTGGPVSGGAIFSISGDVVTITLENLLQNPKSAAQLLSGISFDISGATGMGAFSGVGNTTTISSGGHYTTPLSTSLTQWQALNTGSTFNLNVFSGGSPSQMIIGPDNKGNLNPSLGGLYNNANPSILGHQPVVLGSAMFTLTIPGVDPTSLISDVVFTFGTSSGEVNISAPDNGASIALLGLGLIGIGAFSKRFSRKLTQ